MELMKSVLQLDRPLHPYLETCPSSSDLIVKPIPKRKRNRLPNVPDLMNCASSEALR